jgi:hypothetical protein
MKAGIRKFENMHIALWLIKDTSWVLLCKTMGMVMIMPTLSLAFYITWRMRKMRDELLHNLAVCCWITANSIWMTGEFYTEDTWRNYAAVFFILGLTIIAWYYGSKFLLGKKDEFVEE